METHQDPRNRIYCRKKEAEEQKAHKVYKLILDHRIMKSDSPIFLVIQTKD
uniref:Uncharacterized protein n=1 Tax=Rhizophora mucronata TaxID=61149 RepID=A0A2P2J442_RHIMU